MQAQHPFFYPFLKQINLLYKSLLSTKGIGVFIRFKQILMLEVITRFISFREVYEIIKNVYFTV